MPFAVQCWKAVYSTFSLSFVPGVLQMLLLFYTCEDSTPASALSHMTLPQFKAFLSAAKVINSQLPAEKLDELFMQVGL